MSAHRLKALREKMAEAGVDALLVGAPIADMFHTVSANRRYLSGFTGSSGWLLVTMQKALIAADFRYVEQAERECPDFTVFRADGPMEKWFGPLLQEAEIIAGLRLGFEAAGITVAAFQAMRKAVDALPPGERPKLLAASPLVERMRAIKEPEEVEQIQRAVDVGDSAFEAVSQRLEPGWTERKLAWEIEKHARENGADGMSFETIVAAGHWGAMPHAQPRDQVIEPGEPIVIDMGVRVGGYCSDLTRTIVAGEPDSKFREIYDIVLTAQLTAEEMVRAGMGGEEAHLLAHNVISEAGYGDKFGHGLGHGVGLQVHESPRLAKTSTDELQSGMVVTIEPGIYVPGWGGVRIEDMVIIENGTARVMSRAPKLPR
jgi:Xaa-Pro aminopeptidase